MEDGGFNISGYGSEAKVYQLIFLKSRFLLSSKNFELIKRRKLRYYGMKIRN